MSLLKHTCTVGLLVATAWTAPALLAQDAAPQSSSDGYAPAIAYPDNGFTWLHHASTVDEGRLRGAAALVESAGKSNYYNSLAAVNFQEAYRRAIDNTVRRTEAYYARRDLWSDYQERYRRKPLDMSGYQKLAAARSPERLTVDEYDAESGAIRWPFPLDGAVFGEHRETILKLLNDRSVENSGWGSRNYEMIRREVSEMKEILEAGRDSIELNLYINALEFLESVEWEARFAPGTRVLTAAQN
ncbi:hypothetical protein [Roseimaritima ulvae]|uniref:Uncharacterized protein n=1 Tax=Roseimaritima ulvae TaxID=980254 RepID=A0A5B9QR67_9BACT|nr:hypothetical protein [Roseimaritima ulvae]QEG40150.1 hypothetical protein UC8_21560 [Roseimaritima ulvae]